MILKVLREFLRKDSFIRKGYRRIKSYYYSIRESRFIKVTLSQVHHVNCMPNDKPELLIVTVAYNNSLVLGHQLRLLPKYLCDQFYHIVVDNSSNKNIRRENELLCLQMKVGYVSLHSNFYSLSNSHGLALNWAYEHLVKKIKPKYFGFLDHDIYPIKEHSLLPILSKQVFFGKKEVREDVWYLWPGFCFFSTEYTFNHLIDFKPDINRADVDTGGLLHHTLYKNIDDSFFLFPSFRFENIREGKDVESDMIEYINIQGEDCWLHSINAGYWKKVVPKEDVLNAMLNKY